MYMYMLNRARVHRTAERRLQQISEQNNCALRCQKDGAVWNMSNRDERTLMIFS
jgi:hypothetical protein